MSSHVEARPRLTEHAKNVKPSCNPPKLASTTKRCASAVTSQIVRAHGAKRCSLTLVPAWLAKKGVVYRQIVSLRLLRFRVLSSVRPFLLSFWSGHSGPARRRPRSSRRPLLVPSRRWSCLQETTGCLLQETVGCLHRPARSAIALRSRFCFTCLLDLSCHASH